MPRGLQYIIDALLSSSGMNKDGEYYTYKQGQYLESLNLRHLTAQGSTGGDIQNIRGNDLKFNLDVVETQNQVVRFYFNVDASDAQNFDLDILDWNDNELCATVSLTTSPNDVGTTITDFRTALGGELITAGQTYSFGTPSFDGLSGYIDLTITTVLGRGWHSVYTYSADCDDSEYYSHVLYEAIDESITGTPICIGSKDILGRLYSFWSPQVNMPTTIEDNPIATITNSGVADQILLTFTSAQAMTSGEAITVSNIATSAGAINGFWVVDVIDNDPLTIILLGSDFTTLTVTSFTDASVIRFPFGYALIHAVEKDQNDNLYIPFANGVRGQVVLRTKELNFRVPKQIDCDGDLTNKYDIYFTDFYNTIRCFYYKGEILLDGAIHSLNPDGFYEYGGIDIATQLIIAQPKIQFNFTGQLNIGGNVPAGNHLNAVRLITIQGNTPTLWTALDNPIPTYKHDFNNTVNEYVAGDVSIQFTTKINQFQVSGIDTSIYKYIELADVLYSGLAVSGIIVTRFLITSATMNIQYTGYENDTVNLDVADLSKIQANYRTARNVRLLDSRLVLSNLTSSFPYNLSDWAQTITYELFQKTLDQAPNVAGGSDFFPAEFSDPNNVNNYVGYMYNEGYRFGVQVRDKLTGSWSDTFFVDDVTFDCNTSGRKTGLPNFNLTTALTTATAGVNQDAGACQVLVPAIKFTYDTNLVLPDGQILSNVIDGVRFVRAECIKEVQASGIIVQSVFGNITNGVGNDYGYDTAQYGDFPFSCGWLSPSNAPNYFDWIGLNPTYPNGGATGFDNAGHPKAYRLCSLYSNDILFGNVPFGDGTATGDKLYLLSRPANESIYYMNTFAVPSMFKFIDFAGGANSFDTYDIDDSNYVPTGASGVLLDVANILYQKTLIGHATTNTLRINWDVLGTPVLYTATPINTLTTLVYSGLAGGTFSVGDTITGGSSGAVSTVVLTEAHVGTDGTMTFATSTPSFEVGETIDNGGGVSATVVSVSGDSIQYAQWYRPILNKYGNHDTTKYIYTGHIRDLTSGGTFTDEVFGGDTFTCHTYLKLLMNVNSTGFEGGNTGIKIYSQSRCNANLRGYDPNALPIVYRSPALFPHDYEFDIDLGATFTDIMKIFFDAGHVNYIAYNNSYNIGKAVVSYVAFDENAEQILLYPARVAWSLLKPQGSLVDLFRDFLPLDFHDLESRYGAITHHEIINGELLTLQPRKWMRQFFNTRGILEIKGAGEVLIGDGSVMSRDGVQLSAIGSRHKWSAIKGKARGGSDTLYWWSADYKKWMRFGADGSVPISDQHDIQSFAANNSRLVFNYDTPAYNYGINGVWDDRYNEVVWTVRGQVQGLDDYSSGATYEENDVVKYIPSEFSTYEQTGEFYISLVGNNTGNQPDTHPDQWMIIPHKDAVPYPVLLPNGKYPHDYYNEYTLAFGEGLNTFHSFYTFKPKIYLKFIDIYLSPDPINQNYVYEHDSGDWCKWYDGDDEDGYVYLVYAKNNNRIKMMGALEFSTEIVPKRIDQWTKLQQTFMVDSDFENINGQWAVAVRNDILTSASASNEDDTSKLWGDYTIIKVTFEQGKFQKLMSSIIKFTPLARDYQN